MSPALQVEAGITAGDAERLRAEVRAESGQQALTAEFTKGVFPRITYSTLSSCDQTERVSTGFIPSNSVLLKGKDKKKILNQCEISGEVKSK